MNADMMATWRHKFEFACVSLIKPFMLLEHLLSKVCFKGTIFARFNFSRRAKYTRCISLSLLVFIGSTITTLLSISTMTMM